MQDEDTYWERYWDARNASPRRRRAADARRRRPDRPDGRTEGLNYWQRRQRRRGGRSQFGDPR